MKKTTKIIRILEDLRKKSHRDTFSLHSIIIMNGIKTPHTRYRLINSFVEACVLVKVKNGYQVVQHEEYKIKQ